MFDHLFSSLSLKVTGEELVDLCDKKLRRLNQPMKPEEKAFFMAGILPHLARGIPSIGVPGDQLDIDNPDVEIVMGANRMRQIIMLRAIIQHCEFKDVYILPLSDLMWLHEGEDQASEG